MNIKKLYLNKVLHLFILYHIWLLFYNLLPILWGDMELNAYNIEENVIKPLLEGKGIYHLWFIPELIVMYIISPILKEAFKTKKICEYFLIMFAFFGGLLPGILKFTFPYKIFVESYYSRTSLEMLTGYIGYFVLGHYINTFISGELNRRKKYILRIVSVMCIGTDIVICGVDAVNRNMSSTIVNNPFTFLHVVLCFCVFLLFKADYNDEKMRFCKIFEKISKYTLGIYLIHPFIIEILKRYNIGTLYPHTIVMIPVVVAIVFAISMILTIIMSKIPIIKKLV